MNQLNHQKTTFKCPASLKLFISEERLVKTIFFVNSETLGVQMWRGKMRELQQKNHTKKRYSNIKLKCNFLPFESAT
jgi:hypothetical protein